jgi:hypothetical protein
MSLHLKPWAWRPTVSGELCVGQSRPRLFQMRILRFIISAVSCIFIGIVFASTLVAEIDVPIKILIAFAIIIVVLILYEIQNTNTQLGKMLYFTRVIYISVEKNRLDPNEQKPARDILAEDIEYEKNKNEFISELASTKNIASIINIILLIIACISAYLAYGYLK